MPIVRSAYQPKHVFKSNHFSTIYAGLLRKVNGVVQKRERMNLPDGDFLDLDWSFASKPGEKLIILIHGLEGNAQRPYMLGSAKIFNQYGFDAVCVNLRSCSGEPNLLYRSYHSGATEDVEAVVQHVLQHHNYHTLVLKGFSLGGNLTLKYVGEQHQLPEELKAAIAVSTPCYLYGSMLEIHKPKNALYAHRFKKHLEEKLRWKQQQFPNKITEENIAGIKTLKDFDDFYTSKAHGFEDALDYYEKASSLPHLPKINIPTLLLNAKNDSFLSEECYPYQEAAASDSLYLEVPKHGGHVSFYDRGNVYYNEKRAIKFIEELNL